MRTGSRDSNRSEPQGGGREADAERSGEQRDSRRNTNGQRGRTRVISVRVNAKSKSHRKPCLVEPGGMARKCVFLLGETSGVRAPEESAEAVVALTPGESPDERRAKEPKRQPNLENSAESPGSRPKPGGSGLSKPLPAWLVRREWAGGSCQEDRAGTARTVKAGEHQTHERAE